TPRLHVAQKTGEVRFLRSTRAQHHDQALHRERRIRGTEIGAVGQRSWNAAFELDALGLRDRTRYARLRAGQGHICSQGEPGRERKKQPDELAGGGQKKRAGRQHRHILEASMTGKGSERTEELLPFDVPQRAVQTDGCGGGNVTLTASPLPSGPSPSCTLAPCASLMALTIARPSPLPGGAVPGRR